MMSRMAKILLAVERSCIEPHWIDQLKDRFQLIPAEISQLGGAAVEAGDDTGVAVIPADWAAGEGARLLDETAQQRPDMRVVAVRSAAHDALGTQSGITRFRITEPQHLGGAIEDALAEYSFLTSQGAQCHAAEIHLQPAGASGQSLLPSISHDVLTPLNHILGFSGMLDAKLEKDADTAREYVEHIQSSGESLLKLMKSVLEIERLTSFNPARDSPLIDASDVAGQAIAGNEELAARAGVSICFQKPAPTPGVFDRRGLAFVLHELIENAVKHNRPGGQVSMALRRKRGHLMVRVADTGSGMTPAAAQAALGRLGVSDVDRPSKAKPGLGITAALLFARANAGRFLIEKDRKTGTAAILTFRGDAASGEMPRTAYRA